LARLAVQTGYFPLYEIENGEKWTLNLKLKERKPIADYLKLQGRFRHLKEEEVSWIQQEVDANYERILKKCGL
ncbi:MAG: pyruvate synthase subunit beta, partial [Candidatus Saccharicenans sp.]